MPESFPSQHDAVQVVYCAGSMMLRPTSLQPLEHASWPLQWLPQQQP